MRIAVVVESMPYISETFVLNHIKGLIDAGMDVQVFAFNRPVNQKVHPVFTKYKIEEFTTYKPKLPSNYFKRLAKGIKIFFACFPVNPSGTLKSLNFFKYGASAFKLIKLFELSTFVTKTKFDIVHCHFGTVANKVIFYQDLGVLNAPVVTSFHGYDVDSNYIQQDGSFYSDLRKKGSLYFSNSLYTKSRLIELGFLPQKIKVIPVSLDVHFFSRGKKVQNAPQKIITVARLVEFKGIEYTLKALAIVRYIHKLDFFYTIIGDGPLQQSLLELTKELRLENNVKFLGFRSQDEIKDCLDQSDIFLLTGIKASDNRQENQGLVIQEAQSMSLPVIVSDVGGVAEGMINNETGYLVEEKNVEQIAEKIADLLTDEELRERLGTNARTYVEQKFSIEAITGKLLESYKQVCQAVA